MRPADRENLPLSILQDGDKACVKEITGGRGLMQRLAELGIRTGTMLKVIKGGGPVIVDVKGSRFVLGKGMSNRVMVSRKH